LVTSKAASYRFEIVAGDWRGNVNEPAEALRIARAFYAVGADVSVRDRSKRRGYLTETELQEMTDA
jgi:hypothetical protein